MAPHGWVNRSSGLGRLLGYITPGGMERFFQEIGVPVTDGSAPPRTPTPEDIERQKALAPKYGIESLPPPRK
jgi:hypothetical protein